MYESIITVRVTSMYFSQVHLYESSLYVRVKSICTSQVHICTVRVSLSVLVKSI